MPFEGSFRPHEKNGWALFISTNMPPHRGLNHFLSFFEALRIDNGIFAAHSNSLIDTPEFVSYRKAGAY